MDLGRVFLAYFEVPNSILDQVKNQKNARFYMIFFDFSYYPLFSYVGYSLFKGSQTVFDYDSSHGGHFSKQLDVLRSW